MDIVTLAAARKGGGSGGDVTKQYVDDHLALKADKSKTAEYPIASATTGINPSITDSADGLIQDVKVYGESKPGKNKLIVNVSSGTSLGLTFTVNPDKTITVTGTPTGVAQYGVGVANVETDKTYILSGLAQTANLRWNIMGIYNDNDVLIANVDISGYQQNNIELNFSEYPTARYITVSIKRKTNVETNDTIYPMLCYKSDYEVDPTYEPYSIRGIGEGGELDITTAGKNLISSWASGYIRTDDGKTVEPNSYWTYTPNYIALDNDRDYVISADITNSAALFYYDASKNFISVSTGIMRSSKQYAITTRPTGAKYIRLGFNVSGASVPITSESMPTYKVQLELGTTATTYEPYVSTSAAVTTGIPLYSVGDVKDELDEKKGVVVKRCEKTTEQGEEIIVPLATAVEIPLTSSELSALRALKTYASTTNVTVTDDPTVDVGYLLNTDNGQAVSAVQQGLQAQIIAIPAFIAAIPEMHRNIFRGKNLGTAVSAAQLAAIADGSFDDLYVGDYWTIPVTIDNVEQSVNWRIADMDYFVGYRDAVDTTKRMTTHHLVIVPDTALYTSTPGNRSNGYNGSDIRTSGLDKAKTAINTAFPDMVLPHKNYISTAIDSNGTVTRCEEQTCTIELMNQVMVFGFNRFQNLANNQENIYYSLSGQFALFGLSPKWKSHNAEEPIIPTSDAVIYLIQDPCYSVNLQFWTAVWTTSYGCVNYTTQKGGVRPYFIIGTR